MKSRISYNDLEVSFMNENTYGVKLFYKHQIHSETPQVLYEEQILKVKAESFDDAYKKADKYVQTYIDKYTNIDGDVVEISLYKLVDCFLCYEEENNIQEIYSGFLKSDNSVVETITTPCEADELRILRHE